MRAREFIVGNLLSEQSEDRLSSLAHVKSQIPKIIQRAQDDYDRWDESDRDTYAGGGICHIIADSIADVLNSVGVEAVPVSCNYEQHVYVVAKLEEGIYQIDIPYYTYEEGGGFSWKKLPDVKFDARHVTFYRISGDPKEWSNYVDTYESGVNETWSKKYKRSINCSHPKGFSQKAHCAGRKKRRAGKKTKSHSVSS